MYICKICFRKHYRYLLRPKISVKWKHYQDGRKRFGYVRSHLDGNVTTFPSFHPLKKRRRWRTSLKTQPKKALREIEKDFNELFGSLVLLCTILYVPFEAGSIKTLLVFGVNRALAFNRQHTRDGRGGLMGHKS